ncbi:TPA: hypothetical protein QHX34_002715 [Klebsiella aerogenes]|nr:hypothetical protein [Klebsiella aerogenes]
MKNKWMIYLLLNYIFIVLHLILLGVCISPMDSLFAVLFLFVSVMTLLPAFFSLIMMSALKEVDVDSTALHNILLRKIKLSLPFVLLVLLWSWWISGWGVLVGGGIASWGGSLIFWSTQRKELNSLLPESKKAPLRRSECLNSELEINPTTGLPMMGAVDSKGNFYGAPAHVPKIYSDSSQSSRQDNMYDYFSSGNDHYRN